MISNGVGRVRQRLKTDLEQQQDVQRNGLVSGKSKETTDRFSMDYVLIKVGFSISADP